MFLCWVIVLICIGTYIFLTTTWGAKIAATYLIKSYLPLSDVTVGSYKGTIEKGLLLKEVTIKHIPTMKEGVVHIQELYLQVPLIHWNQISTKVINGRLELASSDPIIFNSTTIKNQLQGNCYAHSVDAHHILSALGYDELAKNIQGFIGNVDFAIDGAVIAPHLTGRFFVDKIVYKDTTVKDGFGHLNLTVLSLGENPSMEGSLILESALVQVHKINIDLTTSKVDFKGNAANPLLDIHGSSKVEDIDIDMAIKGSLQKPQLIFNSDPPMPEDEIKMILVTGKSWSEIDNDRTQSFGLRKKLTDSFNVGMEFEEIPSQPGRDQSQGYSKTLEGQMNVTDKFSFNVAKKFLSSDTTTATTNTPTEKDNSTEFYLQYKRRF